MNRSIKYLIGCTISAPNGETGKVKEVAPININTGMHWLKQKTGNISESIPFPNLSK